MINRQVMFNQAYSMIVVLTQQKRKPCIVYFVYNCEP